MNLKDMRALWSAGGPIESGLCAETTRRFRADRVEQVRRQAGLTIVINTINASLLAATFRGAGIDVALALWLLVIVACGVFVVVRMRAAASRPASGSTRSITRMCYQTGAMAVLWGVGIALMGTVADSDTTPVLGVAIAGMLAGGTISLYQVPRAAVTWLAGLGAFAIPTYVSFGPGAPVIIALTVLFLPILAHSVLLQAKTQISEAEAQRDLADEREVTDQLLRHYEDAAADRAWETDADGMLVRIPEPIAAMLGHDPARSASLVSLLATGADAAAGGGPALIAERMDARHAFADVGVAIEDARSGTPRHVRLRGRPTTDAAGGFAGYHGFATDVTSERVASDRAAFLATHDALTGLANRVALNEHMDGWVAEGRPFALLALDLDRFKLVNDTLGHPAGDELLVAVSKRLNDMADGHEALVCRAAGDEFFVALAAEPGANDAALERQAHRLAQRVVDRLGQPYLLQAGPAAIGSSAGTALFPRDAAGKADLMSRADVALYAAKANGRGVHHAWEPQMDIEASRRRCLESDLRHALEGGEMSLMFQPIYEIEGRRAVGMEALLRWSHAERGNVSPAEFLPTAEETGLIVPIGEWVLREACREAATWDDPLVVSVNVSVAQIAAEGFAATVMSAVASAGLPPQRLELDVTERALIEDRERTLGVIRHLRSFGVRVALDDFGMCYATIAAMHDLMFDRIKIDGALVGDLDTRADGRGTALVSAIVGLAAKFDIPATAESVEHADQAALLRELGCTTGQGYHFGRPTDPAAAAATLAGAHGAAVAAAPAPRKRTLRVVGGTASLGSRARLVG